MLLLDIRLVIAPCNASAGLGDGVSTAQANVIAR